MRYPIIAAALLIVAGCVKMTPQDRIDAAQQVTCNTKDDCELKWARATKWLQDNSAWKMRTVTESMLTTEGPNGEVQTAYEVTKFPMGGGVYEIQFKAGCQDQGLGCHPSVGKATASFKNYVATGTMVAP